MGASLRRQGSRGSWHGTRGVAQGQSRIRRARSVRGSHRRSHRGGRRSGLRLLPPPPPHARSRPRTGRTHASDRFGELLRAEGKPRGTSLSGRSASPIPRQRGQPHQRSALGRERRSIRGSPRAGLPARAKVSFSEVNRSCTSPNDPACPGTKRPRATGSGSCRSTAPRSVSPRICDSGSRRVRGPCLLHGNNQLPTSAACRNALCSPVAAERFDEPAAPWWSGGNTSTERPSVAAARNKPRGPGR